MIKIENLEIGKAYAGEGRNFDIGIWNGKGFLGVRYKFGWMDDVELHWAADDRHGTFRPERELK